MYYIGVDIGGTGIQAGIVDEYGQVVLKKECRTNVEAGFESIMDDIKNLVDSLLLDKNISIKDIKSVGFGVPSFINNEGLISCVNLGWNEVNFIKAIKDRFEDIEVFAENDAKAAALAEAKFGSMKNKRIGVMYTLGTGVGGGIVINEDVFIGANNMGGAIGHTIIGENYYDCNCGNNGCLETFCSATAIIKYATKLIKEGHKSIILDKANNDINSINAKIIFEAFKEDDSVAIKTINRFKLYLAKSIASMINTLDPDVICIGGGVSRSSEIILDKINDLVREHLLYKNENFAEIVSASLGADAGIIGAAFLN